MALGRARLVALSLVAVLVAAPSAAADGPLEFTSDNIEFIDNIPLEASATGANLLDGFLYVSSSRGLHIYDVRDPAAPGLVGEFTEFSEPLYPLEDPATNGKILLHRAPGLGLDIPSDSLFVLDVRDKTRPFVLGELRDAPNDLTFACIFDCKFAYGSYGAIVNLRDPTSPRVVGNWRGPEASGSSHSISEIAPGLLIIDGGQGPLLLSARDDPTEPEVVNDSTRTPYQEGYHAIDWPAMKRSHLVFATAGSFASCSFISYDASRWRKKNLIKEVDRLRMEQGSIDVGGPPASFDCPHWFDAEPGFRPGGLLVAPWHQRGLRIIRVTSNGELSFEGYFVAPNSWSWTTLWGPGDYLFSIDYNRGIDILRFLR